MPTGEQTRLLLAAHADGLLTTIEKVAASLRALGEAAMVLGNQLHLVADWGAHAQVQLVAVPLKPDHGGRRGRARRIRRRGEICAGCGLRKRVRWLVGVAERNIGAHGLACCSEECAKGVVVRAAIEATS